MKANGSHAKILQHSTGMGVPDSDAVRKRAREIAEIDGRDRTNQQDWDAAKRELHGGHDFVHENGNGGETMAHSVSGSDMVAGSVGHHAEKIGPDDTDPVAEELIAEGMDEAEHEQMLEARRTLEEHEE